MCLFIETICYEQGHFQRIDLHNARFNRTRQHFFGWQPELQLELFLSIPEHLKGETVKCTITYGSEIIGIEYRLYKIRPVNSLQLVKVESIDYSFKYADRTKLDDLYQLRNQSDDILVIKNGFITDTSYANIILLKNGKWYSPQNPLLWGTRLEDYFREGLITPALLRAEDLHQFSEARIINALISIEKSPVISIENIQY